MATYAGGTRVEPGCYLDRRTLTVVNVESDGTPLPGTVETRYVRVPLMALLAAAPALGGLLVIALPLIRVATAAQALARSLAAGAKGLAATVVTPAAAPGRAHLLGHALRDDEVPPWQPGRAPRRDGQPHLEALEEEVERQRGTVY